MTKTIAILLISLCILHTNLTCMDNYTRKMADGSQRMPKVLTNYYIPTYKKDSHKKRIARNATVERNKERYNKYSTLERINN